MKGEAAFSPNYWTEGRLDVWMDNPIMRPLTMHVLFFRVRLLLEEGQKEQALSALEMIQTDDAKQQREKAYFLGWCYVLHKRWDDALHALLPFSQDGGDQDNQIEHIDRERLAYCLLYLGYAAINLCQFEDAERHLKKCLKVLRHKQLQHPKFQLLRIQANYSLGVTYSMRGFSAVAIQHYEEALRLYLYVDNDEELANIYYGLCDIYRRSGQLSEAQQAGEQALHLYERAANRSLEGRMRNLLGYIAFLQNHYHEASAYYTESLTIAAGLDNMHMIMLNCAGLARLRAAEGHFEEARRYCQRAQELCSRSENHYLRGLTYLTTAKVMQVEAQHAEGESKGILLEEAAKQFEIAYTHLSLTEAYDEKAETLTLWAQVCEALGHSQESVHLWRTVYQMHAKARGLE